MQKSFVLQYLDVLSPSSDESSLWVEAVEAQSQLEFLVEEDEDFDSLVLRGHWRNLINAISIFRALNVANR